MSVIAKCKDELKEDKKETIKKQIKYILTYIAEQESTVEEHKQKLNELAKEYNKL